MPNYSRNFKFFVSELLALALLSLLSFIGAAYSDDEFDSTTLNQVWIWDDPSKECEWSLTEVPGWLQIICAPGEHDVWDFRGPGPMMLAKAPEGNYSVETHIRISVFPDNSYAGLVVIGSEGLGNPKFIGPWGLWRLEVGPKVNWSFAIKGGANEAFARPPGIPDEAYLKLAKVGDDWECYYKEKEGDDWELIGTGTMDIGKKHYVGFNVGNWDGTSEVKAEFEYFRSPEIKIGLPVEPAGKLCASWGRIKVSAVK